MFKFKKGDFLKKKNSGLTLSGKYLKNYPDFIKIKKFADNGEYIVEYSCINKSMKIGKYRKSIHSHLIDNNYEIDFKSLRSYKIDKLI